MAHFKCQTTPRAGKPHIFFDFRVLQSRDVLVIGNSDFIFAKILSGRSLRPYLWSQLALTAKMTHFQCQTIPRAEKPPILTIFVCYSP